MNREKFLERIGVSYGWNIKCKPDETFSMLHFGRIEDHRGVILFEDYTWYNGKEKDINVAAAAPDMLCALVETMLRNNECNDCVGYNAIGSRSCAACSFGYRKIVQDITGKRWEKIKQIAEECSE